MKIGLVSAYDIAIPGGVNSHIANLAREFRSRGHAVRIVAPGVIGRWREPDTIPIGRSVPMPSGGSIANVTLTPWLGGRVKEVLAEERFDVVHIHEPYVPMLPAEFLRHSKAVNVGTFHAAHENGNWIYRTLTPLMRYGSRRLAATIAVSPAAARFIARYVPGEYEIIPNGMDVHRFSSPLPRPPALDARSYVLFVGRFEPRKGLGVLLRAWPRVKERHPGVRLVVVGEGERRERYEAWIAEHSLRDVEFTGYVPDAELPAYYQHAAAYCAPNTGNESFGIVLLEAMAAATPVVASDIEGFRAVVTDGEQGLLVPPLDPGALAEELDHVLSDTQIARALVERGRCHAQTFDWPRVAERVVAVYERALDARGAAVSRTL